MGKTKTAFVGEKLEEKKKVKKEKKPFDSAQGKVHIAGLKGGQRIKVVEAETLPDTKILREEDTKKKIKVSKQKVRSKKYKEAKAKVKAGQTYKLLEAVTLVKETSYSKFDGSVELHLVVKKTGTFANLKTEKEAPLIHTVVGKVSQKEEELADNIQAILTALEGDKQIVKAYIKASMGPSIKLQV